MQEHEIIDLKNRVLRGEEVTDAEIKAALAAMCTAPPPSGGKSRAKATAVPAFDALAFLRKRAETTSGEGAT